MANAGQDQLLLLDSWSAEHADTSLLNDDIVSIAIGDSATDLFAAYGGIGGVVRAIDVKQRSGSFVYRCPGQGNESEWMNSVAYNASTKTLFVCTWRPGTGEYLVRSFVRNNPGDKWQEYHSHAVQMVALSNGSLRILSDGSLVLGRSFREQSLGQLRVLSVDQNRKINESARITLHPSVDRTFGFDAKLEGGRGDGRLLLAIALHEYANASKDSNTPEEGAVDIYRVVDTGESVGVVADRKTRELSRCTLRAPRNPLFCGTNSLLVYQRYDYNDGLAAVHQLRIGDGGTMLGPGRVVFSTSRTPSNIGKAYAPVWCVSNSTLVAWNLEHHSLTTYSLESILESTLSTRFQ